MIYLTNNRLKDHHGILFKIISIPGGGLIIDAISSTSGRKLDEPN